MADVAVVWWLVKVTAQEPGYPKYYGPFKQQEFADKFAAEFVGAEAETIGMTPAPNRPHKMDPHMKGYKPLPATQKPRARLDNYDPEE